MGDLAKDVEQLDPEAFKANAEYFKYRLDVAKATSEDSFTRKAAVWMTGLMVPMITAAHAFYGTQLQRNETERQQTAQKEQTDRQNKAQVEETKRKQEEEATKRHVENARLALEMYVKNKELFDRSKTPNAVFHVRMIAVISDNAELKAVFNDMLEQEIREQRENKPTLADAVVNLPDRIIPPVSATAEYPSFLTYVQALPADADRAQKIMNELRARKFKVPGLDTKVTQVPPANELRYYRASQKEFVDRLAADLGQAVGEAFTAKALNNPNLPDGIIEVWIAKRS
jgi:hypothetical protein